MTTATGTRATMLASMAPRRKDEHRIELDDAWRRMLAQRVERLGLAAVARKAGIGRMTIWRLCSEGQRGTVDAAERVRLAVMALEPEGKAIPRPVLVLRKRQ